MLRVKLTDNYAEDIISGDFNITTHIWLSTRNNIKIVKNKFTKMVSFLII